MIGRTWPGRCIVVRYVLSCLLRQVLFTFRVSTVCNWLLPVEGNHGDLHCRVNVV